MHNPLPSIFSDINECAENADLCGVGSICSNNGGGLFYECDCRPGTVENDGDPATLALTCVGRSTSLIHCVCIVPYEGNLRPASSVLRTCKPMEQHYNCKKGRCNLSC